MEKQDVFVSLFDFLGKPAGTELGKAVYMSAKNQRQVTKMREVSNKKYTGKVVLYKPEFLEEYFTKTQQPSVKTPNEDYELPF